ncbi:MAG: threonyl-tRNA synthetase editing domain-containing protein [Desulfosoma sp.]
MPLRQDAQESSESMKLLMFYAPHFWYRSFQKTLAEVPDREEEKECRNAVVIFFHAEAHDDDRRSKVVEKWVKNAKWIARKFDTSTIVLHSFNHLADTKASFETARAMVQDVRQRLERTGFTVLETPFGYLNEWKIHVAGDSLAKVFKDL